MSRNPFTAGVGADRTMLNRLAVRVRNLERRIIGTAPRIAYGQVFNDGDVIDAGSGDWTSAEVGLVVTVTFDPPFASPPAVLLTANKNLAAGAGAYFVEQAAVADDHFDVAVYQQDGTAADGGFNFIAIGS